ncbi:hypothetical protein F5Y12DRAFT_734193 [Xylaria sp. FL1777]|nr:hypothetical protein F5Y12DRAFT_734193 [Xylaria sp. FL1777]
MMPNNSIFGIKPCIAFIGMVSVLMFSSKVYIFNCSVVYLVTDFLLGRARFVAAIYCTVKLIEM